MDPFNQPTELTSHQKNTASVGIFLKDIFTKIVESPIFSGDGVSCLCFFLLVTTFFGGGVLRIFKKKHI